MPSIFAWWVDETAVICATSEATLAKMVALTHEPRSPTPIMKRASFSVVGSTASPINMSIVQ